MKDENRLNDNKTEKVNGGISKTNLDKSKPLNNPYGESVCEYDSQRLPRGQKLIYTDDGDDYLPHRVTYVKYLGDYWILVEADGETDAYLKEHRLNYIGAKPYGFEEIAGQYYIKYSGYTYNHLYK